VPESLSWQQRLGLTALCTAPGLVVRLGGGAAPPPLRLVAYAAAVIGAAFMLAWACEAAQVDIAHGLVLAIVAFVAILPEYVVEAHFAFIGHAEYVTANLTGAIRLLLGFCVGMPAVLALLPDRWRPHAPGRLELAPAHRLELAVLGLGAMWAVRIVLRGQLSLLDGVVLIALYVFYVRRVATIGADAPPPIGVAARLSELPRRERRWWTSALMVYSALVILLTAVPFGDSVLATGRLVGISPYLMLQWLVPVATEMPEIVVAFVLLMHGRGGQSVAVLLAGAVSQYTLALGTLPIAYAVGRGTGPLPLAPREQAEMFLTIGLALYAVAALVRLRVSRADATIMLALFSTQLLLPTVFARLALAIVYCTLAVDVLLADRRQVAKLAAAVTPRAP
jgi:cation:H+ antiporter